LRGSWPTGAAIATAVAESFVLDTSAVLALRGNEPGADRVEEILRSGRAGRAVVVLSFMTRMEMLYRIAASDGEEAARDALRLIEAAGVTWISCGPEILEEAARLKARAGLSIADAWIAATALVHGSVLVHKDPEFARAPEVRQEKLRRWGRS
jgi:predicted nucleic acid-binding protein